MTWAPRPTSRVVDGGRLVVGADGDADGGLAKAKRGHVVAAAAVEVHLAGGGLQLALDVLDAVGIDDDVGVEGLGGEAAFGDAGADGEAVAGGDSGEALGGGTGNGLGLAFEVGGVGVGVVGDPGAVDGKLGEEDQVAGFRGGLLGEGLDLLEVGVDLAAQGAEGDEADAHKGGLVEGFWAGGRVMDGGSGVLLHGEEKEAVELALVAAGSTWGAGGGSHPHPALSPMERGKNPRVECSRRALLALEVRPEDPDVALSVAEETALLTDGLRMGVGGAGARKTLTPALSLHGEGKNGVTFEHAGRFATVSSRERERLPTRDSGARRRWWSARGARKTPHVGRGRQSASPLERVKNGVP